MATTPNYHVDPDNELLTAVKTEEQTELDKHGQIYDDQIAGVQGDYDKLIQHIEDSKNQQIEIQNQQTDFAIEKIEQQKDQAHKDYVKEQSGAYVDWQKQSNQYGASAEQMAAQGMTGTGFSESSQVSMYNTYQNRIAQAREIFNQATINYNNAMKEARLQNSSILAEIADKAYREQLELGIRATEYKNQLILEKANKELEIKNMYHQKWMDVLNQINTENDMAFRREQFQEEIRQFNESYQLQKSEFEESIRQFNEEIARLKAKDAKEYELEIKALEQRKKEAEQEQKRWEAEMAEKKRQFDKQFNAQYGSSTSQITKSSGATGSGNHTSAATRQTVKKSVKEKNSSSSTTYGNNMASITALGYGPISASRLAELMASGKVTRTLKNGQYYYSRNNAKGANRLKNMGLSY
jgi:hypothetical protein